MLRVPVFTIVAIFQVLLMTRMGSGQQAAKKIFLLQDDTHHQWCGFSAEAPWRAEAESLNTYVNAMAEYEGDRVSMVYVTTSDESGDWVLLDLYNLDSRERPVRLERKLNVIPEQLRREQIFLFKNGKPIQQSSTATDPETGKPVDISRHWVPEFAITARSSAFPFWTLLRTRRSDILSQGKACLVSK